MARLQDVKKTLEQERRALGEERARVAEKGAETRSMAKSMDESRRCDWLDLRCAVLCACVGFCLISCRSRPLAPSGLVTIPSLTGLVKSSSDLAPR